MLDKIQVGDKVIGKNERIFVTAEIGQNHNGDIETAKKLIDMSAIAGADAVKFCKRNISKVLSKDVLDSPYTGPNSFGDTYGKHREALELSDEEFLELSKYAKEKKIIFYASVCDEDSVELLEKCGAPLHKIASRDLVNLPLLEHIAKKGKPIILSTGMSSEKEVDEAVAIIKKHNQNLILMHVTSQYPCDYENIYLKQIPYLQKKYGCLVGFSGHSIGILMPILSTSLGAVAVEKHVTLSRKMKGTDHAGALELPGLLRVVRDVRNSEKAFRAMGERKVLEPELVARNKLGKSIVARRDIKKGEKLEPEMLCIKGNGLGLTPRHAPLFIGKEVTKDITTDSKLALEDIGLSEKEIDKKKLSEDILKFDWTSLLMM